MNVIKNAHSITIEFTEDEFKILANDLVDPLDWIEQAMVNKLANRKSALIKDWTERLRQEKSVESIPTDETAFLDIVFNHPKYRNRIEREDNILRAGEE